MKAPVLSVCIPTYNFGAFIGEAIESVLRGPREHVEIIVLDGGSTDCTAEVVAGYQARYPIIRYVHQAVRGGIDADMARTVALAGGEYCWLLSADDALAEGAIERMLDEIRQCYDIYFCNRLLCDRNLRPLRAELWLEDCEGDAVIDLGDASCLEWYFRRAETIGALFSYMSSIVVKRSSWNAIPDNPTMAGTNYAHAYRLFSMGRWGGKMKYLRAPLVLWRGGNDSFMSQGMLRRTLMDIRGYATLAEQLFGSARKLKSAFLDILYRHQPYAMVVARGLCADAAEWKALEPDFERAGYPRWVARLLRSRTAIWPCRVILRLHREAIVVCQRIAIWRSRRRNG